MIYCIKGKIFCKSDKFVVLEVNDIGYKIFISSFVFNSLPKKGEEVRLFIHHQSKENINEFYGFLNEEELEFFELLLSVSGVGPKSALNILNISSVDNLKIAISSNNIEFLNQATGIGRKTIERIILELKQKFANLEAKELEDNLELEEALISLGYSKKDIKKAISNISDNIQGFQLRFKETLKLLGRK
jgi:Holliday junction DNA helicase RuvA